MTIDEVKLAVTEAMREEMKEFKIEREVHYQDHQFIAELRKFTEACKVDFLGGLISIVIKGVVICIIIGFAVWIGGKDTFKWFNGIFK